MSDKVQLIKEEIGKLYKRYIEAPVFGGGYRMALDDILEFIDSLPEESGCEVNFTAKSKDLEKEIDEEIDNLCELGCYMEDLAKGNSEGVYPLPDNVVKELRKFAHHFAK